MKYQFHPHISEWFHSNFIEPTPPQKKGWPLIASGKNCLILAPTGSGKTLAAFLWCIDQLIKKAYIADKKSFEKNPDGIHTLYISPLKALNNDIYRNLEQPLKDIKDKNPEIAEIRKLVRTGDTPQSVRQAMIRRPPHILITTPESLYLLLTSQKGRLLFGNLRYIIVDEIHAVCGNKRGVHLSLSLERLIHICNQEPVRIGLSATQRPLDKISRFLGGQRFDSHRNRWINRPVEIVDTGQRKNLNLKVMSPVSDFADLPDASAWPGIYKTLYDIILNHKTTLVFVNMRAQTETIARRLNEMHRDKTGDPDAQISLPHHGSISREIRTITENRLKNADIPAVITTASLELGIDIGSVDIVIQLESTKSVAAALQRIGRSGHSVKETSKGRIVPMYAADLDDTLAITSAMKKAEIEKTTIPENCLDVLSQQIAAEVSMQNWNRKNLYNLVRQSYCYRDLSETVFNSVIEMLHGKFAGSNLHVLQSRINWDRSGDMLYARKGLRLIAVMNGGTIPDRGYFAVYLQDENIRLGEMEEEFVFESRVGTIFFLGNSEWQIKEIKNDRLIVSAVTSEKPKPPFWKGELLYRDYQTAQKIALFRRHLNEHIENGDAIQWIKSYVDCDDIIAKNIVAYFQKQKNLCSFIPDDKTIVVERFTDATGENTFIIHAPYGARVTGAWVTALTRILKQEYEIQAQFAVNDDGFMIKLAETEYQPDFSEILKLSFGVVEKALITGLESTPLFPIRFRMNAMCALLMTRSQPGKRVPLWLQRIRAADLLQVAKRYEDFPILIETYRDCLNDYFDLNALQDVINKINAGEIRVETVETPYPSPMATGLLFRFLADHMYLDDRSYGESFVSETSTELFNLVVKNKNVEAIITPQIIKEMEEIWQFRKNDIADTETLYKFIEINEPVHSSDIKNKKLLDFLLQNNRIMHIYGHYDGYITAQNKHIFKNPEKSSNLKEIINKKIHIHGPRSAAEFAGITGINVQKLIEYFENDLLKKEKVIKGHFIQNSDKEVWCARDNFLLLYRKAIVKRREYKNPADFKIFYKYLLKWHDLSDNITNIQSILEQYKGYRFSAGFMENEILPSRTSEKIEIFYNLFEKGQLIALAQDNGAGIIYFKRGEGRVFTDHDKDINIIDTLSDTEKKVIAFMKENGASFFQDMVNGLKLNPVELKKILGRLAGSGLISCDNYLSFRHTLSLDKSKKLPGNRTAVSKRIIMERVRDKQKGTEGRWFLVSSFSVMGKELSDQEKITNQTLMLLKRYGILVKEWYRQEKNLLPWYMIFRQLKKMEWQNKIRRGYFIKGLSGIQFALPEALKTLEDVQSETDKKENYVLISTADPALPLGGNVDWNLHDMHQNKVKVVKSANNHLFMRKSVPVLYSENRSRRIVILHDFENNDIQKFCDHIKKWLKTQIDRRPRKIIEIELINNDISANHDLAELFKNEGFEPEYNKLVLWPSAI